MGRRGKLKARPGSYQTCFLFIRPLSQYTPSLPPPSSVLFRITPPLFRSFQTLAPLGYILTLMSFAQQQERV